MGFVKISDDLASWEWYGDNNTLLVYIRLLLGAVWRDTDFRNVTLHRGQIATTLPNIARENGITERQARTILDRLKSTGKVSVRTTTKFSIITLLNYDCAFENVSQNDRQMTVKRQTTCQSDVRPTLYNTEYQNNRSTEVTSASPTAASISRENLIEIFGENNVDEYEKKYDNWRASKGGTVRGDRYETIRRMMEQDKVQKPVNLSSFDKNEVMRRIIQKYKNPA